MEKFTTIDLIKIESGIIHNDIPQGLITKDGLLYCVLDGNHFSLYKKMKESGIDVEGAVRYGFFFDEEIKYRKQHFSNLKEYEEIGIPKLIKLTNEQAEVIDRLRVCFNPDMSLQDFLVYRTVDLGFSTKDYLTSNGTPLDEKSISKVRMTFNWNFLTFEEVLNKRPSRNSNLDRGDMYLEKKFIR